VLIFAALPSLDPGMQALYQHAFRGEAGIVVLGDLYAFGAATIYSFVFIALIALRLNDPLSPRKFRIPLNIPFTYRGERVAVPIVGVIGFLGIFSILIDTLITHEIGRVAGPTWIIVGFIGYLFYRKHKGCRCSVRDRKTGKRTSADPQRTPASWRAWTSSSKNSRARA